MNKGFRDSAESVLDHLIETPLRRGTPFLGGVVDMIAAETDDEYREAAEGAARALLNLMTGRVDDREAELARRKARERDREVRRAWTGGVTQGQGTRPSEPEARPGAETRNGRVLPESRRDRLLAERSTLPE